MKKCISINKTGQAWSLDLVIAITIFIIGLIGIYVYALNLSYNSEERLSLIRSEAELVSSVILSEGYPENWTIDNVEAPGIISEDKINQTKLEKLYLFSSSPEN